ncbi:MAG: hypothetical protein HZA89_16825 [Verrucomicrobia bacterium]|nr:hypothetical protein [Verrucomicrobiota bacterium]
MTVTMKKWIFACGLTAICGLAMLSPSRAEASTSLPLLTITNASGFEGDSGETNIFNFTVTLSPSSTQTVSVAYCTFNGSAQSGADYVAVPTKTLIFQPGETNKTITVQVLGDNVYEADEYFYVQLFSPTNAVLNSGSHVPVAIDNATAVGTIVDDDAVLIFGTSVLEGDVGTNNNAVFQVRLAQPATNPVSLAYTTVNGTTTAGEDFIATNGVITFPPGQTNQNIVVRIVGDIHHEFDEVFYVRLSGSTNSDGILVREKQAAGVIREDGDHFFFLTAYPASVNEGTPGVATNQMRFLVTLNQPGTNVVTVNYQTFNASSADISYYFDAYQAIEEYTNFIPSFVFEGAGTPARAGVDYVAVTNTLTFLPGQTTQYVTVQVTGNSTPEADKPFVLYLSNPVNAEIYNDSSVLGVIVDDDAFGTPVVTISNEAVVEGDNGETNRTMLFHVQLNSVRHAPFALSFTTTNTPVNGNNASAGPDYVPTSGTLNFANGQADQYIPVTILNDNWNETNEIFRVKLTTPAGVYWASNATYGGIGTIIDNDPLPYVTISSYTNFEGDTVNNTAKLYVKLSAPSGRAVTVSYATAPGTAKAGSDYKTASGTVTFPAGTITNSISVTVYGDVLPEADETFFVNLTRPVNATIAVAQGLGVIRNDDIERFITIGSAQVVEGNSESTSIIFTVSLSAACAQPVTVDYATANGTAGAGSDYTAKSGALIFPPGVTNQTISVEVFGDITPEADEAFYVDLSNPFNASLGSASRGAGTITNDDGLPGYVHRFVWGSVSSTQFVNQSFTVTVTALDISNRVVTNFTGPANLAGTVRSVTQDTNLLGGFPAQSSQNLGGASFSAGFSFTPNTNLVVTHVRHYFGTNVSIWTDSGVLLASQSVSNSPGRWQETPLSAPLELTNGHTYRLACIASGTYHYRTAPVSSLPDGSLGQNFIGFGTSFPNAAVSVQNLVDIRYTKVLNLVPISITPAISGAFTNGVWAGNVTVLQTATNAFLSATDNDGHAGNSGGFDVTTFSHMFVSLGYELVSTNGASHFKLLASPGQSYVIERSSDLLNWTPIYTNQTGLTGCDCVDAMPATATRFYRARRYLMTE